MDRPYRVEWTKRSLINAIAIKNYLIQKFTVKEVVKFEKLLRQFELTVSNFPTLYPGSKSQKLLRRAVIHKKHNCLLHFQQRQSDGCGYEG